jgi:hypothetical protein
MVDDVTQVARGAPEEELGKLMVAGGAPDQLLVQGAGKMLRPAVARGHRTSQFQRGGHRWPRERHDPRRATPRRQTGRRHAPRGAKIQRRRHPRRPKNRWSSEEHLQPEQEVQRRANHLGGDPICLIPVHHHVRTRAHP